MTNTPLQPGDEIDVGGTTIVITRQGFRGTPRYSWYAPAADLDGEASYPTTAEAVDSAFRTLNGPRCECGQPATMNASTRKTCIDCYDRHVD